MAYVIVVFFATVVLTWAFSDWWPDRVVVPAIQLALAVAVIAALSLAGSVVLAATANGIAVFMLFGAGLDCRAARADRRGAGLAHARHGSRTS